MVRNPFRRNDDLSSSPAVGRAASKRSRTSHKEKNSGYPAGGYRTSRWTFSTIAALILRFCQFVMGVTVIGVYGVDLHRAAREHKYSDSKWGYAVAVGSMSAITALVYMVLLLTTSFPGARFLPTAILCAWDVILTILWAAVLGIFGSMYFNENAEMDAGITRMKRGAWIDLVNLLLWLIGCLWGGFELFRLRKADGGFGRSQYS